MSGVLEEKKKKDQPKTSTVDRWTAVLEIDGNMVSAGTVEGTKNAQDVFEKALRWLLIFHSKNFPWLKYDDVLPLVKSVSEDSEEVELPETAEAKAKFVGHIPLKDDDGNDAGFKEVKATLFEFTFTQF